MTEASKSGLASLAGDAAVHALYATAQGLWFLAQSIFFGDPRAAAAATTDFEAAATYEAIGGIAAAAASAVPNGGRGGYGGGAGRGYGRGRYAGGSSGGYEGGGGGEIGAAVGSLAPGSAPSMRGGEPVLALVTEDEANRWVSARVNGANNSGIPMTVARSTLGSYAQG